MVPVFIETLILGSANSPSIVVLRPDNESSKNVGCVLPILIGPNEAGSIGFALNGTHAARPMTHDLFTMVLNNCNLRIDRIVISRVEGPTFFAELVIDDGTRTIGFDSRPSDCIALAIRTQAPIFVEESVLETASYPYVYGKEHNAEEEMRDFHSFIENVSTEDFYAELEKLNNASTSTPEEENTDESEEKDMPSPADE
jgi:uncharacterized protein